IAVLSHFLDSFATAERSISREREFAADRIAANATSGRELSVALVKIHSFGNLWNAALQSAVHVAGPAGANASETFSLLASRPESKDIVFAAADEAVSHPTDSHPLLGERLHALGFRLEDVARDAQDTDPADPSVELIDNYAEIERELTRFT